MIGMNIIFHVIAGFVVLLLIFLWLDSQRQRDFIRRLRHAAVKESSDSTPRFKLATPQRLLADICDFLQIPFEKQSRYRGLTQRIELRPLGELLLTPRPALIRWKDAANQPENEKALPVRVEIVGQGPEVLIWQEALRAAFGSKISVMIERA